MILIVIKTIERMPKEITEAVKFKSSKVMLWMEEILHRLSIRSSSSPHPLLNIVRECGVRGI